MRLPLLALIVLSSLLLATGPSVVGRAQAPRAVTAQTGTTMSVTYTSGWNMVGGPPGASFSAAQALYSYNGSSYVEARGTASLCQGAWAYFASPSSVTLAGSPPATTQACPLRAGWTLVSDPFLTAALLPKSATAFYWNSVASSYDVASAIPLGGAVWIYSNQDGSVTLQAASTATPAVTITTLTPPSTPYQMHVGSTIELRLSTGGASDFAMADPHYLVLEASSGAQGGVQVWRWQAVAAGNTAIQVLPACRLTNPHCNLALPPIKVDILP